jgi:Lon-like protease
MAVFFEGERPLPDRGRPKAGESYQSMAEDDRDERTSGPPDQPATPRPVPAFGGPEVSAVGAPSGTPVGYPPPTGSPLPGVPQTASSPPPPRARRSGLFRPRWVWILFLVIVVAIAVASRIDLNYYALQPGTAQSVQQFITVPPDKGHPVSHPVLLTDVEEGRVTALSYLIYKLQSDTSLYPVDEITGGTPPSQLIAQGNLEMSQAESYAKTAALRRLGYTVTSTPAGAVIFGTFPGTPAYSVLHVGDVVTAVDGTPTLSAEALSTTLDHYRSGQTVTLSVRKGGTGAAVPEAVTLHRTVVDLGEGVTVSVNLGIEPEDQVDFGYPFPVSINVTNIGGPSAGLAMTLGVIDALTSGSLTGGRTVAATGTMNAQGDVGDVGGVAQKTVAVENAGASIFFVPPQEYKAAMSKDRPGLKVYPVSTLNQVLTILDAHGGAAVPNEGTSASVKG